MISLKDSENLEKSFCVRNKARNIFSVKPYDMFSIFYCTEKMGLLDLQIIGFYSFPDFLELRSWLKSKYFYYVAFDFSSIIF